MPDNRAILIVVSLFDETTKTNRTAKRELLINEETGVDKIVYEINRALDYIEQEN